MNNLGPVCSFGCAVNYHIPGSKIIMQLVATLDLQTGPCFVYTSLRGRGGFSKEWTKIGDFIFSCGYGVSDH